MNIFTFVSFVLFCGVAVGMFIFSVLVFSGSKLVYDEKMKKRYHVNLFRLHNGFFYLGYSLFAAAAAYLTYVEASGGMILTTIFLVYGIGGSIHLSKSKRLVKDPGVVIGQYEIPDNQILSRGLMLIGFYMLLPVLFLVGAILLY